LGYTRSHAAARRAVGQWPTAENLVEALAAGIAQAADHESDPERRTRLRAIAQGLGSFANAVAINVVSQALGQLILR
jgi:hypothetical protein